MSVIDRQISESWKLEEVQPAPLLDDAGLLRRTTLDLVGRIPTAKEVLEYTQSTDPDKRQKLVQRLIDSPAFARYQASQFENLLLTNERRNNKGLREYLERSIRNNRSWELMFRDLLTPDESDAAQAGASEFLRSKLGDQDRMTAEVSSTFFGVNISCAQCHDHPNVHDWTQDHFYGMKSFLARTVDAGGQLYERGFGQIKYLPNKGQEKVAPMMFLTGQKIETDTTRDLTKEEQKAERELIDKAKKDKKPVKNPAFSARAELVKLALAAPGNQYLAKSIVNQIWYRYFGYGLVNPLDQMHSENPASHPELLKQLAQQMIEHQYNLRWLTETIVLSDTYGRSSRYDSAAAPYPATFAVAQVRALTPMQLMTSLKLVNTSLESWEKLKPEDFDKRIEQLENSARGMASKIAEPTDNFQIGVSEALLFSNADNIERDFLQDGNGTLLQEVQKLKTSQEMAELLIQRTYSRPPQPEEVTAIVDYLDSRKDRPKVALQQVFWALLTSSEFRFNH